MEDQRVSLAAPAEGWPAFFRRQVAANVRFWLEHVPAADAGGQATYPEHENVLKALDRALELETAWDEVVNLFATYHPFVERRGGWGSWVWMIERGLQVSRRHGNRWHEATLTDRLGEVHRYRGDWREAEACHRRAVELFRACDEAPGETGPGLGERPGGEQVVAGEARALANLGEMYQLQHRYAEAEQVLELALDRYRAAGNAAGEAFAHNNLGLADKEQGLYDEALLHFRAARDLWSESGTRAGVARAVHNEGTVHLHKGDRAAAEECLVAAARLYEETGSALYAAVIKIDLGNLYLKRGQPAEAEAHYRQALAGLNTTEYPLARAHAANNLGMACARQGRWDEARTWYDEAISRHRQVGNCLGQANSEDNLAEAYIAQARWQEARAAVNRARALLANLEQTAPVRSLLSDIEAHEREIEAGAGGCF